MLQVTECLLYMKECGVEGVDGELSSDINAEMEQEKIMLRQELQQSSALVESLRMEVQVI